MWNRTSKLSSSETCLRRKAPNDKLARNNPNMQESTAAERTPREHATNTSKKNALAQLRAMYPGSSGESSSESSNDNEDAVGHFGDKTTKTCKDSLCELSGKTMENEDQNKREDQVGPKMKEVDHQKYHGYCIGGLLSQLRSENATKQSKSKKLVRRNVLSQPPKKQGPCRELQFHQHDGQKISQVLYDPHQLIVKKNGGGKRNGGAIFNTDVAVPPKKWIEGNMESYCGQSSLKQDGKVVESRSDGSQPSLKHTDKKCKNLINSTEHEGMVKMGNVMTGTKAVVPSVLQDSPTWHLVGQLVSRQANRLKYEDKAKPFGTDIKPMSTHQGISSLSQGKNKDEEMDTKDHLLATRHLIHSADGSEDKSCRKEAEVSENQHILCFNRLKRQHSLTDLTDTLVQLCKDPSSQQETGSVRKLTETAQNKHRSSECNQEPNVVEVPLLKSHSEVMQVNEKDILIQAMKPKEDAGCVSVNMVPASFNPDIENEERVRMPSEVRYNSTRQRVRALANHWKGTKKEQGIIEESEQSGKWNDTVTVEKADQPQEMQKEVFHKERTTSSDHRAVDGTSEINFPLLRSDEVPLQDNEHIALERGMEAQVNVHIQFERDVEDVKSTQRSGNGTLEAEMGCHFPLPSFPRNTKDTLEMPVDDHLSEGKRAEVSTRDSADERNDQAFQDSDITFMTLTRKSPADTGLLPPFPEKSQRLYILNDEDDSRLEQNLTLEQKERPLHEARDDYKIKVSNSSGLEKNKEGDVLVDAGMQDTMPSENVNGNNCDVLLTSYMQSEIEEQSVAESRGESDENSNQSMKITSRESNVHDDVMDVSQGLAAKYDNEKSKDARAPLEISDSLNQDLVSLSHDQVDEGNNQSGAHFSTSFILPSTENSDHSILDSHNNIREQLYLETKNEMDDESVADTADTGCMDLSVPSGGSDTVGEEVTSLVCQESDQSIDGSLMGLSDALDREFDPHSPSPTMIKDVSVRLGSIGSVDCAYNVKPEKGINTSLMDTSDDVGQDGTKLTNSAVDNDDSSRVSSSASPCAGSNESPDKPTSDHMQGVFTCKERETLDEDFNLPFSPVPREGGEGPVAGQSDAVVSEFDTLIGQETHQDLEDGTLKEMCSEIDRVSEQDFEALAVGLEEEPLSTSHIVEEITENDDALSLICDTEDLMSNLEDLLQDESLQLSKQSPTPDESKSIGEKTTTTSTSTIDTSCTNSRPASRTIPAEPSQSPQRSRIWARSEDRPWESKQGFKMSIHSRNGNTRFVCKNQESHRAVVERSPKRVTGPNRNWTANKPLSASERLALHQRLGAQKAANASPNLALQQLMRNGPAIKHSGILQHQLHQRQQLQQQQELQRQLQSRLPPALQLRLGLIKNQGLQPMQNTSDDVAIICQRQQAMIEKIIQLYQKQRESDVVIEKQKNIIRHYQRAFLIAKKGGPISMREMPEGGSLGSCSSSRPTCRSPSPSGDIDSERKFGRKWSLPNDSLEERRYGEHPEAKRMKLHHQNVEEHPVERFSGLPNKEQPQRHVERRIVNSRGNPDRSDHGAGWNVPQRRQPENLRFQSEGGMLISVPTNHPDDERHQERRCILQRSTPIFSGTRNHPHSNSPDAVFQPIQEGHDEQLRGDLPRVPFLKSDVARQASPVNFVEQYGDFNVDTRSPCMFRRGFPHQRPHGPPRHTSQQECTSSVMSCQGRGTPSSIHPNWESCRITERDPGTGMIIDYCHTSLSKSHPWIEKADMHKEILEPPPFIASGRQGCSSPLEKHPLDPRVSILDDVSQAVCRAPKFHDGFHGQGTCRAPFLPSIVDIQGTCRAPMRPSGGAPLRPSLVHPRAACRAPSVIDDRAIHRAPFGPSVVAVSHHWVAQNFQEMRGAMPRLHHPSGHRLLQSQMQSRMEYRQEHGCPAGGQFEDYGTGIEGEWDNGFYG